MESSYMSKDGYYAVTTAACPECKGRCEDLVFAAEKARLAEERRRRKKRELFLRYFLSAVCSFPFLVTLAKWQSNDLSFLLFTVAVWFLPFRNLDIATKSVMVVNSCIGLILLRLAGQVTGIRGDAAFLFSHTPVKYLFIVGVTYLLLTVVRRTSDFAGAIYTGPSATEMKFGRINKLLLVVSLLTIVGAVIFGSYYYISGYFSPGK